MKRSQTVGLLALVVLALWLGRGEARAQEVQESGASASQGGPVCTVGGEAAVLPNEVRETSGLAGSGRGAELFWTHNDAGNAADLYAVDATGQLVQHVVVEGAEAVDWEDIESGRCDSGSCLFIGDIGDNDGERESITIYRIPEPDPDATVSAGAIPLHVRYPDQARDAESLFRLPSGEMYLVTKGRSGPIELYRIPEAAEGSGTVVLERVRELFAEPQDELDRVTAATASPNGEWVAVRSYRNLYLYRTPELTGAGEVEPIVVDLAPLSQPQGESVVLRDDGTVWMSSEAANDESSPAIGSLRCTLPSG